jgi:PST family polysaccharide transporter
VLGTLALTAVNILKLGLQFAVLPIIARILGPSSFGLVAVAMPFILLANIVSDCGLGSALVRKKDSTAELEATVFWLSLLISTCLAVLVSLFAWPASRLMSEPQLLPIVAALSLILPIAASLSVANARITRERKFTLFAVGEIIASLLAAGAGIGGALAGLGPWSLVLQQFVLWGVKVTWLLPASGFRPALYCKPALVWPHLHFGLNAVGASLADFAIKNLPTVIVGSLMGIVAAGHYAMAYQIVRVPELIISGPIYLSIFAAVAQWGDNRLGAAPLALKGLRGLVTILAPLFCGLALIADLAVQLVLGPAWAATGPILTLLAPAGFFLCLYSFVGAVLMGLGQSPQQLKLILLAGVSLTTGTVIGSYFGAAGVAAGLSVGAACAAPAYFRVLSRELLVSTRTILAEIVSPLFATLVMALAIEILLREIAAWAPWRQLLVLMLGGFISFSIVLIAVSWRRLGEDIQWLLASRPQPHTELAKQSALGPID